MPRLFVTTLGRGLLRSDNLGRSWTTEPGLPPTGRFYSLYASPGELLVGGEASAYRYSERAWSEMPLPPDGGSVWALTAFEGAILVAAGPGGLLRSADGGRSWERLELSLPAGTPEPHPPRITALLPNPSVSHEVWAAVAVGGVFASTDGGRSWSPANDGIPSLDVHALAWSSGGVLLAATPAGVAIWRSARWVDGQFDPADRYCRGLASRPDDPGALYCGFGGEPPGRRGGVAVSTDGGRSWRASPLPDDAGGVIWSVATAADMPGLVLACSLSGHVYVSLDRAATWRHVLSTEAESRAVACLSE